MIITLYSNTYVIIKITEHNIFEKEDHEVSRTCM